MSAWKFKTIDTLFDYYFSGFRLEDLCQKLGRDRKEVLAKLRQYLDNENERAMKYTPVRRRYFRKGKQLNRREVKAIKRLRTAGVASATIARILMRNIEEVDPMLYASDRANIEKMKSAAVGVDLILAYRHLYYCHGISVVSDKAYDELMQEEIEYGGGKGILDRFIGSDCPEHYPHHIRALALYLGFKYTEREKKAVQLGLHLTAKKK